MTYDDNGLHEAIGWMSSCLGGPRLAVEAQKAAKSSPHIAAHLLRWADLNTRQTTVDFEDRRRHRPDFLLERELDEMI